MSLVEFMGVKGRAVWINSGQVTHVLGQESGQGSMYGSNNEKSGARIVLAGGEYLDVRQTVAETVALLDSVSA